MATFGGFDLSTNLSLGMKIAHGYNFNYDLAGKKDLTQNKTTIAAAEAKFAQEVNNVVGGRLTNLAIRLDNISQSIDYKTAQLNTKVASLQTDALAINTKFNVWKSTGVDCTFECANYSVSAGNISITGLVVKLG
jgi:hypothetical protein